MINFIILNYKNINDTLKCLECLKCISNNYCAKYIVVDNNSISLLEKKILKKCSSDLICLNENMGFAKANNLGIAYSIKKYNPDFVCVINSDVFITQLGFISRIYDDYKKYKFDILGPRIYSPSNESINPFHSFNTISEVTNEINKTKKLIFIYSSSVLYFLLKVYFYLKYMFIKKKIFENGKNIQKNVALHGCAIIFSKKYLNKYKFPFDNRTFLFHEEEFLYQRVLKDKLTSIYDSELKVFHKEGSSLKNTKFSDRLIKLYKEKEKIKSLSILLEDMIGGKNNE